MTQTALDRFRIHPAKDGEFEIFWKSHGSPSELLIATQTSQEWAEGYVADLAANEGVEKLLNVCTHINLVTEEETGRTSSVLDATEIIELLKEAGHTVSELKGHRLDDQRLMRRWIGELNDVFELTFVD